MKDNTLFIHIPKTGGTTLYSAVCNSEWIKNRDRENYRHLNHQSKYSESGDIFDPKHFGHYKNYLIYTMLRHPVDKVISEYYFIKDRPEYFSLIKRKPKSLESYIKNSQTQNATINFLLGRRYYAEKPICNADLNHVIKTIDDLDMKVCIFEEFEKSLAYMGKVLNVRMKKTIRAKRVTLNRPQIEDVNDEIKELIQKNNTLDLELYLYYKKRFEGLGVGNSRYTIIKDKYDYVLKYTERFTLLDLYIPTSNFIRINRKSLISISQYLKNNTSDGVEYVMNFNQILIRSLLNSVSSEDLYKLLDDNQSNESPLDTTKSITEIIIKEVSIQTKQIVPILQFQSKKKSILKRIFGK